MPFDVSNHQLELESDLRAHIGSIYARLEEYGKR
jgi:hypothetical protein